MISRRYNVIAREGKLPLVALLALAIVFHYLYELPVTLIPWIGIAVVVFLYRDPTRKIPPSPLGIVAPVDSKVIAIENVRDPYVGRNAIRVRLENDVLGVYTVRSPMEGKITKQWFNTIPECNDSASQVHGKNDSGGNNSKSVEPVAPFAQWTTSDEGDDVVLALKPRFNLKPSRCASFSGERIGQGQRCSFVPFGASADVYLPENTRVDVIENEMVKAGSSIIATLVR